jgi:signal transduction histidine kinase/ligand-binding sensor domain-containing protein
MLRRAPVRLALVLILVAGPSLKAAATPSDVRLRDYIHTVWTQHDGVPLGFINAILQTSDGYLWIFTKDDALRFDGMRFVRPSTPCTQPIRSQTSAVDGGFWAVCGERLIRRTAEGRFVVVSDALLNLPQHTLFADRQGRVWILGPTIRYLSPDGTAGRVFDGPRTKLFFTAVQDSEGTIWARDRSNLYQLYDDRAEFIMPLDGGGCLTPSRDGGVYALARTGIWRLRKGVPPAVIAFPQLEASATPTACMAEAKDGGLWLGMRQSMVALLHGGDLELLADTGQIERGVNHLFIDREGSIWAGAPSGLHRFRKPMVQLMQGLAAQPLFVFVDSHTNVWQGSVRGTSRLDLANRLDHPVTPSDSYDAIGEDERGTIWLSNRKAIGYVENGRFVTVSDAAGAPVVDVHAFTQDEQGHLWALAEGVGAYQVTPGPPRLVAASPRARDRFFVSRRSGISLALDSGGVEQHRNGRVTTLPSPNATQSYVSPMTILEDGDSLWVGSATGLERLRNGRWTTWTREHGLPGDGTVKIEAGTQRQVTYGTLRPGEYRFRVIGAGAEGLWNETGGSFAFRIVPVYWRTWWFQLSMVALGLSIAGALYRLRIRQLTRQFNVGVAARIGERTRIARELHDTLLQSFQGVLIHFQAATNLLPGRPDEARRKFESALDQAGQALTEGRDAVQAMRESAAASDDLPDALSTLANQLAGDVDPADAPAIRINVEGRPRSLQPIVRDDVYRIASEAIRNAVRHAQAQLIQVDIHYDDRHLQLRIRDDGTGIDAAVLESRGVSGHWGMPGMRERAALIGGTLSVRSRIGSGTEIELSLPSSKAYVTALASRFPWSS